MSMLHARMLPPITPASVCDRALRSWRRKCVDAIKAQNVIDAKKMEAASNTADALSPPIEVAVTHYVPVKKWDTPVLSPLLGELVVLEMGLGRRAPAPIERKFVPSRKNIGAVIIDAEWNVAHQRDAASFGVGFDRRPLFARDPLDVTEEVFALTEMFFLFRRLSLKPGPRCPDVLMLRRPLVPRFALAVLLDERAKERAIIKPGGLLIAEISKLRLSILRRVRREVHERFLEQTAL